jgi:hypothetical protein
MNANIKLEELRKRLLEPVVTPAEPSTSRYRRSSRELHADQPRSNEPEDSASHQQPTAKAVAPETAPAPELSGGVSGAVSQYVELATASSIEGESQLVQAVAKVFEQTQTFQDKFAELTEMFEPIERIGQATARSLEPLRSFEQQLVQLAHSFEPMRAFQIQLAQLAQTFEPMKGLQEQFAQLSEAFQIHLNCLAGSLQPARQFQLELLKLARVFDSVADLQAQFTQLAETFKSTPAADGNDARPAPASVQH